MEGVRTGPVMVQQWKKGLVLLIYVGLLAATVLAFEQVGRNGFIDYYDDGKYVTANPQVKAGLTQQSVLWAFTSLYAYNWHPLTWLSHMADCELFGLKPGPHHLVNLLFHAANVLLLFAVFKRMTGAIWASAFVAAAFAVHPLHVESVAWVAERKDVLSGFFWMVTVALYICYVRRPGIGRYVIVVLAFCLGLTAKPMLVTLPFVLLLLDYWPLGRLSLGQAGGPDSPQTAAVQDKGRTVWYLVREKLPLFVLAAGSCVVTYLAQQRGGAVPLVDVVPFKLRLANAATSYIGYLSKMIYPNRLAVFYPYRSMFRLDAVLLLAAISVLVFRWARGRPWLTVGWLWYLGTLVPVIGLVRAGSQAMADRYTYLPSIGIFIIVAWGAAELSQRWHSRRGWLAIPAAAVLAALLICTRMQVRYWRTGETLFKHAIDVTENNYVMHFNLAKFLRDEGRFDEAVVHYSEAVRIYPEDFEAHNNMGAAFLEKQRFDEAIACFNNALAVKPDYFAALNNLAMALRAQGKINEAIEKWEEALRVNPNHPIIHYNIGIGLAQQGKSEQAAKHLNEALRTAPDPAAMLNNLAWFLATAEPTNSRNVAEAVKSAQKACELTGYKHPELLDTLAVAYAAAGRFPEAVETAEKAVSLAVAAGNSQQAQQIQSRLQLYRAGQPYRSQGDPADRSK